MAKKKKKRKRGKKPDWATAKTLCRLNAVEIQMAKELGMTPKQFMDFNAEALRTLRTAEESIQIHSAHLRVLCASALNLGLLFDLAACLGGDVGRRSTGVVRRGRRR